MTQGPPSNLYSFRGGKTQVNCILPDLDENNELLYVGTNDGNVNIWDLKVTRMMKSIKIGEGACLCILKHKNYFLTQEKGESIKFWTLEWIFVKEIISDYVGFCKIVCQIDTLVYASSEGKFTLYDINNKKGTEIGFKFNKKPGQIMYMLCTQKQILVLYEAGFMCSWNYNGIKISEIDVGETPMCLDFCEKTQQGIIGSSSSILTRFDLNTELKITKITEMTNPGVSSITIHKSGRIFVAGCWDGSVKYYNTNTLQLLAVITNKPEPIQYVVFASKPLLNWGPNIVFVGGPNEKISLCNLYNKELEIYLSLMVIIVPGSNGGTQMADLYGGISVT